MRRWHLYLAAFLAVFSFSDGSRRQKRAVFLDHTGTKFALGFMRNLPLLFSPEIVVLAHQAGTTVNVSAPGIAFSATKELMAEDETWRVQLPASARADNSGISDKGILVTSSSPVTLYGINIAVEDVVLGRRTTWSEDAFLALPIAAQDKEYIAGTYTPLNAVIESSPVQFSSLIGVVAVEDGTVVNITLPGGVVVNETLNALQMWQLQVLQDLTGAVIEVSKPSAVFSGNECPFIPIGVYYCDHLVEQLPPVSNWGIEHVTSWIGGRTEGDIIRVISAVDNNEVLYTSGGDSSFSTSLINRGGNVEIELNSSVGYYISCDGPCMITQYNKGSNITGSSEFSDPFMIVITPNEQFLTSYKMVTLEEDFENYVSIVVPTSNRDDLLLNGSPLASVASFTWDEASVPIFGVDFSAAAIPLTPGVYELTTSAGDVKFAAYFYGHGRQVSYGLPAGTRLFRINDVGGSFCTRTPVSAGDGVDNDCDGDVDEEVENGQDDDGDGRVDEDLSFGEVSTSTTPLPNTGDWSQWSTCSRSCGPGLQRRSQQCTNPLGLAGSSSGSCSGDTDYRICKLTDCPVNGNWGEWSPLSPCVQTCKGGFQIRVRDCNNPHPIGGGEGCEGDIFQYFPCGNETCASGILGTWSTWSNYSECSHSCGTGVQLRQRNCQGGGNCEGDSVETRICNTDPCPINGHWSPWCCSVSPCSRSCGGGVQTRSRECANPVPAHGGANCTGNATETIPCNIKSCIPLPGGGGSTGVWSQWGHWSYCTKSCASGQQRRMRTCASGGCSGDTTEIRQCNTHCCQGIPYFHHGLRCSQKYQLTCLSSSNLDVQKVCTGLNCGQNLPYYLNVFQQQCQGKYTCEIIVPCSSGATQQTFGVEYYCCPTTLPWYPHMGYHHSPFDAIVNDGSPKTRTLNRHGRIWKK